MIGIAIRTNITLIPRLEEMKSYPVDFYHISLIGQVGKRPTANIQ